MQDCSLVSEFNSTHENKVNSITHIDGFVWTTSDDATIKIWDAVKHERVASYADFHSSKVYGVAKVASTVWSFSWDRSIHVWDAKTLAHRERLPTTFHDDAVSGIVAHRNTKYQCWQAITSSLDRAIVAWLVNEAAS